LNNTNIINLFSAELKKLKSTPIWWIVIGVGLFITSIVYLRFYNEVNSMAHIGVNPWDRTLQVTLPLFAGFMMGPLVVLLVSGVLFIEQRSNAHKYLYTMPTTRGKIYFSKLFTIIALLFIATVLLGLFLIIGGYIQSIFRPEYEWTYYQPNLKEIAAALGQAFFSALSIVAFQYFLCTYFKHFMIPLCIGFLGYVTGFILAILNNKIAVLWPFAHPVTSQDISMFRRDFVEDVWGVFNNVDVSTIIYFIIFVLLGYIYEVRRNVV